MTRKIQFAALAAMVALGACQSESNGGGGDSAARDHISAVGSSTVYPFTTAVAEQFQHKNPAFKAPVIESTGTGAGMHLFCGGVGAGFPDIEDASRRIKKSEWEECTKNGVSQVVEIQIGIDGIILAEASSGPAMKLTPAEIYRALAAKPFGHEQTAQTWHDVNPSLPAEPILVYGPPPTSGTRDAFVELIMDKGCDSDAATKALKDSDADRHKEICSKIREDGKYVESGENDNLIVQKLAANPNAIGIFGYSFLEENADKVRGIAINDVVPTYATIADYSYPGARPLFIYVKSAHLNVIPGLREFVNEYASAWGPDGYLKRRGLIAAPDDIRAKSLAIVQAMTPMDPTTVQ